ncbi:MAG: hypothetical protein NT169_07315 [Chloroflexi bacterium]|nr:hypothetical protein [Chloroflexota bacterium]
MKNLRNRLAAVWERGCGILTILLITLPLWVMTLAFRGPLFAIGALAVLFAVVIGFGAIGRWLNGE